MVALCQELERELQCELLVELKCPQEFLDEAMALVIWKSSNKIISIENSKWMFSELLSFQ